MSSDTPSFVAPPFREWPKDVEMKTYRARCHCGKITFEFDHPALEGSIVASCNCSWCSRTGGLYIYGPPTSLRNTSPDGAEPAGFITKANVHHRFCSGCGCILHWTGLGRSGANVRMFEGVDLDKLHVEMFDGAHLL